MRRLLLLFLLPTIMSAQVNVTSGVVRRFENFNSNLVEPRNVDVWLPDGYSAREKYAVLYMHDGQMLFDPSTTWNKQEWRADETAGKLMKEKKAKKFIIVAVSSIYKVRHSDYFPQKPFESLTQKQQDSLYKVNRDAQSGLFGAKVGSDNYLKFLVTELKPFIDKTFSVKKDRENTFIAGASMGGLISMYAICEYPEIFGGAACISTHWPGVFNTEKNPVPETFFAYMRKNLPDPKTHKFYFDYGNKTLDALYEPYQLKVDEIMKSKGYDASNWITKPFYGADHSEKSWAERFEVPLMFLLGK